MLNIEQNQTSLNLFLYSAPQGLGAQAWVAFSKFIFAAVKYCHTIIQFNQSI